MASGNKSTDGCIAAVIAFFIALFLPAWVMGDNFSWKDQIGWGLFLIAVTVLMMYINHRFRLMEPADTFQAQPSDEDHSQGDNDTENEIEADTNNLSLQVGREHINTSLSEGYKGKLDLKAKTEREIEQLRIKQHMIDQEIGSIKSEQQKIRCCADKPLFISKEKYLAEKKDEIEEMDSSILQKEEEQKYISFTISKKRQDIGSIKYKLFDESNDAFEELKKAFEAIKSSCYIDGTSDIKKSAISAIQREADLKDLRYTVKPYGLMFEQYRFYIFPAGIWVFEGDGKLAGIYHPEALNCNFESIEKIKYPPDSPEGRRQNIYDDTKTIMKEIPHTTWLHIWRDGSPDMRFGYNPSRTYHIREEYYWECFFELDLCGCKLKYEVSSYDNCMMLEKAITDYRKIRGNKDIVPTLLSLLERCSKESEIQVIREKIAAH